MTTVAAPTPDVLLAHWQGHRRLTRRTIEAFPDDEPFAFTAGGPRCSTSTVLYFIDDEVQHRGEGYVYLRLLGIEPPPFYQR